LVFWNRLLERLDGSSPAQPANWHALGAMSK
jgi:hypothetical protein